MQSRKRWRWAVAPCYYYVWTVRLGVVPRQDVLGKRLTEGPLAEAKTSTGGWEEAPSVSPPLVRVGPVWLGTPLCVVDPPEKDSEITLWPLPVFQMFLCTVNRVSNRARQNWSHYLFSKSVLSLTFPMATETYKSQGLRAWLLWPWLQPGLERRAGHSLSFSPLLAPHSLLSLLRSKAPLSNVLSAHHECKRPGFPGNSHCEWVLDGTREFTLYFLWETRKALFWNGSLLHGLAAPPRS